MLSVLWNNITGLFEGHVVLLSWLGGLSLLIFFGSLIAVPLVAVRLPEDYLRWVDEDATARRGPDD